MIVIYLSLHSPYEYNVTIPRTTLSSHPSPRGGKESPNKQQTDSHFGVRD